MTLRLIYTSLIMEMAYEHRYIYIVSYCDSHLPSSRDISVRNHSFFKCHDAHSVCLANSSFSFRKNRGISLNKFFKFKVSDSPKSQGQSSRNDWLLAGDHFKPQELFELLLAAHPCPFNLVIKPSHPFRHL